MANLYYREDLAGSSFSVGASVEVTGEEARHAVRVSRLRVGERIAVGNGAGVIGAGAAVEVAKDRFTVLLDEVTTSADPAVRLVLVQALAKGDRDERAVEQATEFGVDAIIPWEAARSVSRWSARGAEASDKRVRGVEKWRRIAREAAKQSMRPSIPVVRDLVGIGDLVEAAGRPGVRLVALDPRGSERLGVRGAAGFAGVSEVLLVVGPEGGFADDELAALETAGAERLVLGTTVLRTSSAGPAALAVLNAALGRW